MSIINTDIDVNIGDIDFEVTVKDNDIIDVKLKEEEINVNVGDVIAVNIGSSSLYIGDVDPSDPNPISEGDLIFNDGTYFRKALNNNSIQPVIGIANADISGNEISVFLFGEYNTTGLNLTPGRNIYVGVSGEITNVVPENDFIQHIGTSLENNKIYFKPFTKRMHRLNMN